MIHIENATSDREVNSSALRDMVQWILDSEGQQNRQWTIHVVFVDDAFITDLNRRFLKKDRPTDVISFDLSERNRDEFEGEVYVSLERARQQAAEYRVTFDEEVARLVAHGVYHLLGYEDASESEREEMTRKEDGALEYLHNSQKMTKLSQNSANQRRK